MPRLALTLAALLAASPLPAGDVCCPSCRSEGACVLKVEPATEEETCYDVECKEVCIPPVRFPWESCRAPKCGRVRVVARLKQDKREEPTCKYEWLVACPRCGRPVAKDEAKKESKDKSAPLAPAPTKPATKAGGNQPAAAPSPPPAPPSGRSSTK